MGLTRAQIMSNTLSGVLFKDQENIAVDWGSEYVRNEVQYWDQHPAEDSWAIIYMADGNRGVITWHDLRCALDMGMDYE